MFLQVFCQIRFELIQFKSALKYGVPEIVNSDQGCQFSSEEWVLTVQARGTKISMDGRRTIKYEMVFLHSFDLVIQVRIALDKYINFYNSKRYHSKLNYHTPDAIFAKKIIPTKKELFESFTSSNQQEATMF